MADAGILVGILVVGASGHPANLVGHDELGGAGGIAGKVGGAQGFHFGGDARGDIPVAGRGGLAGGYFGRQALGGGFHEEAAGMAGIDDHDDLDAGCEGGKIGRQFIFGVIGVIRAQIDVGLGEVVIAAVAGMEIDDGVAGDGLGRQVGKGCPDGIPGTQVVGEKDGVGGNPAASMSE